MTKLEKLMTNPDRVREVMEVREVKRIIMKNSCPSEFGLEDCEFNPESGCTLCCVVPSLTDCWNQEVES